MQISGGNPTYNKISESYLIFSMLLLFLVIPFLGLSQIRSVKKSLTHDYFQVGFDAGVTYFFGDVDERPAQGGLFKNNIAYKLHAGRNFGSLLLIDAQISFGNVSGEKKKDEFYSYFKSSFVEYTFGVGINTVSLFKQDLDNLVAFYINFGLGLIDIKATRYNGFTDEVLQTFGHGDDQKATTEMVIPLGGTLIFNISPHSSVSIQTTISRVDTDKMDALEGNDNRDYYNYTSIGYVYKIFNDKRKTESRNKPPVNRKRR